MCAQMKLYKVEKLVASCLRLINQLIFLHEENGEGYLVATCSLEAAASLDVATSFSKWAVFVLCDVPKNLLFC